MKKDMVETHVLNYEERKCKDCGQQFEVRVDHLNDLYAEYCAQCFFANVRLYADGSMELKEEKSTVDTSYKDELQGVTHRGKHRVEINGTSYRRKRQIAYDMTDQWSE